MRHARFACVLACLLAAAALAGGCGSSSSDGSGSGSAESHPAPPKSDFPSASGKTLTQVLDSASHSDLVVLPAARVFYKGQNRYPFGVFHLDHTPVDDAKVALYFAKVPPVKKGAQDGEKAKGALAQARDKAREEPAIGPFPASVETLATEPAFRAATTADDPNAATSVYTTNIDFPSNGEWRIAALVKEGDELKGALLPSAVVGEFHRIPQPGQKAPLIHTPTPADVGGDLSKITTRVPPDTQNRVDYADAYGKEPIILLFATPQFCESRVCGPVVDVAEQVKQIYGDKAAFIHMEIYDDNDPSKPVRPQVKAFHLPTEPWLFAIKRDGTVGQVIEGAFGVEALTKAVKKVTGE
jgi:hypothetical protein